MTSTKMKAVVVVEKGKITMKEIDVPTPGPNHVLIKIIAAAQNPTDWKHLDDMGVEDAILGCDGAGVIEKIGPDVPDGVYHIGQRVAIFLHGNVGRGGTFTEYQVIEAGLPITLPDNFSFEDGATIPVGALTACQLLYQSQGLPSPRNPVSTPFPLLVWGGASAVGLFVIQLAKLANLEVIATASPRNHALLKSFGADAVFDYRDPDISKNIKEYTKGKLAHAVDCVSEGSTPKQVSESMGDAGGDVSIVLHFDTSGYRQDVKFILSAAYSLCGQPIPWYNMPAIPEHRKAAEEYAMLISELLKEGKLKTVPIKVYPNGLASVEEGLKFMKEGHVSAQKLIYRIADTPSA